MEREKGSWFRRKGVIECVTLIICAVVGRERESVLYCIVNAYYRREGEIKSWLYVTW